MLTDGGDENYGGMFFDEAGHAALDDDARLANAIQNSLDIAPVFAQGAPPPPYNPPPYNPQAIPIAFPVPASPARNIPMASPVSPIPYIPVPPPDNRIAKEQRRKEKEDAHEKRLKDQEDANEKRLKDREDADERRRQANEARSNSVTRNIIFRDYDYDRENRLRLLALGLIPDFPYISKSNLEEKLTEIIKKELKKDTTAAKPSTDEEMVKLIKVAIDSAEPKKASKPKKKSSKKKSTKSITKKKSSKKKSKKKGKH